MPGSSGQYEEWNRLGGPGEEHASFSADNTCYRFINRYFEVIDDVVPRSRPKPGSRGKVFKLVLKRDGETLEIGNPTWAEIIVFVTKCGWKPSVPTHYFLASNYSMSQEDAHALATVGRAKLDKVLYDPLSLDLPLSFDIGKFAEVIEFASGGGFVIGQAQ